MNLCEAKISRGIAMGKTEMILDEAAKKLFNEFDGLDKSDKNIAPVYAFDRLSKSLTEEQKKQDIWRLLLIDTAHLISSYFLDVNFLNDTETENKTFKQLASIFSKLKEMDGNDGTILIRYRGSPRGDIPEKFDYEILYGNIHIDTGSVPALIRRQGFRMSHLAEKMARAFSIFANYSFSNIQIKLPQKNSKELKQLRTCLHILSNFRKARQTNSPIVFSYNGKQFTLPVVKDEKKRPDPNLTLIAGLSSFKSETIQNLVDKVDSWMQQKNNSGSGCKYSSVYDAIFGIKILNRQLVKPNMEVNNVKWVLLKNGKKEITKKKAAVSRFVVDHVKGSSHKVVKVLNSVYGDDFKIINSARLGSRLQLSSDLLTDIENKRDDLDIESEVLSNIETRLDKVRDEVYDKITINKNHSEPVTVSRDGTVTLKAHDKIDHMVTFYKGRSITRQKMKVMAFQPIHFDKSDYSIIAKDFNISIVKAKDLVGILKNCFHRNGRFSKSAFLNYIPQFVKYEKKIFEFLWHHLKDSVFKEDRIPFLNSLQILAAKMKQPKRAFKILLADFCENPSKLYFSDNKAIMLANLVVHGYDKELADIEITPEDILLNPNASNSGIVGYASWRIDKDQDKIFEKTKTIHSNLREALEPKKKGPLEISARHLLALERELYIFLSLTECVTGKILLRSAVTEYGNPKAEIYSSMKTPIHLSAILQNLRVIIRGIGCIGGIDDIHGLHEVKKNKNKFMDIVIARQHKNHVKMIGEWIDEAVDSIRSRV